MTRRSTIKIGIALVLGIIAAAWISGPQVLERISETRTSIQHDVPIDRWLILKDSAGMLRERPLMGWGLGCLPTVYPAFRSFHTNFFINQAHNDYLQVLVEAGLAGFCVLLWFIGSLFRNVSVQLRGRNLTSSRLCRIGAFAGALGILIHSFTDYNLHIPANAAMFYVFCVIAASTTVENREATPLSARRRTRLRFQARDQA